VLPIRPSRTTPSRAKKLCAALTLTTATLATTLAAAPSAAADANGGCALEQVTYSYRPDPRDPADRVSISARICSQVTSVGADPGVAIRADVHWNIESDFECKVEYGINSPSGYRHIKTFTENGSSSGYTTERGTTSVKVEIKCAPLLFWIKLREKSSPAATI
jgi:hypothetical protein